MKGILRLTVSVCLLGSLVLLNACNSILPTNDSDQTGDSDPVDTGTYSIETEEDEPTDSSHDLPRGEIPFESVVFMGTHPLSDNPDLPENIQYLDDTRDLKDKYTLDEAVSRYAIRLYNSTVICNGCEDYVMTHSFRCTDYGNNYYECSNNITLKAPEYLSDNLELQDTTFASLSEFKKELEETGYVCIKDYWARQWHEDLDSATIIEQTEEYVFASAQTKDSSYSDIHYQYYLAEVIGGRVYLTWFRSYNENTTPLTDNELNEFKNLSLLVLSHLEKDDGKEPYIYDKFVNISWFGDNKLRSFNDIESISTSCDLIQIPGYNSYCCANVDLYPYRISIDPDEYSISESDGKWENIGDMKSRILDNSYSKIQQLLFTKNGVKYLVSFSPEGFDGTLESSDAFIEYLKNKKVFI